MERDLVLRKHRKHRDRVDSVPLAEESNELQSIRPSDTSWKESSLYGHCIGLRKNCIFEPGYNATGLWQRQAIRYINWAQETRDHSQLITEGNVEEFWTWNTYIETPWHNVNPPCLCSDSLKPYIYMCEVCYQIHTRLKRLWYLFNFSYVSEYKPGNLCGNCRYIDFQYLFRHEHGSSEYRLSVPLGSLKQILENENCCGFCRLLVCTLRQNYDFRDPILEISGFAVLGLIRSYSSATNFLGIEFQALPLLSSKIYKFQSNRAAFPQNEKIPYEKRTPYRIRLHQLSNSPKPGFGRPQSRTEVNCNLLKKWIGNLDSKPSERAKSRGLSQPLAIRVIDVHQHCITTTTTNCRYLALSYVWGGSQTFQSTVSNRAVLEEPGGLRFEDLPATLKDAAFVTAQIGERFLWIDSLCIIQDDPNFKHSQIAVMDRIYQSAVATIVAAGGSNVHAGLTGLRRREWIQHSELIQNMLLANRRPGIAGISEWSTRAWVYQEEKLSRRLLMFTTGGVELVSEYGTYHEDIYEPVRSAVLSPRPLILGQLNYEVNFTSYGSIVSEYTSRKISYNTDALNAFAGIMAFLRPAFRGDFVYGLPVTEIDAALLWRPLGHALERRIHPTTRKPLFPSWSWAGWTGPAFYEPAIRTEHISKLGWIDPITGKSYGSDELRYALPEDISKWKQGRDNHRIPFYFEPDEPGKRFLHPTALESQRSPRCLTQPPTSNHLHFWTHSATLILASYTLNESLNEPANIPQELTIFSKDGFVVGIVYLCGPKPSIGGVRPGEFIVLSQSRLEHQTSSEFTAGRAPDRKDWDSANEKLHVQLMAARGHIERARREASDARIRTQDPDSTEHSAPKAEWPCCSRRLSRKCCIEPGSIDIKSVEEKIHKNYPNLVLESSVYSAYDSKVSREVPFDRDMFDEFKKWCLYNVMMIEWDNGGVASRTGIGVCHIDAFEQASPVRKRITLG